MGTISRTINAARQNAVRDLNGWHFGRPFRVGDHVWLPPTTDAQGNEQAPRQAAVVEAYPVNSDGVRRYRVRRIDKDTARQWVSCWDESQLTLVEVKW